MTDDLRSYLEGISCTEAQGPLSLQGINTRADLARFTYEELCKLGVTAMAAKRITDAGVPGAPPTKLKEAPAEAVDVFLTHTWVRDECGRDTHARVGQINTFLKVHGVTTWYDSDRMTGNIVHRMARGIDMASVVIVCITRRYMDKLGVADDNCEMEFAYAANRKGTANLLPVVMEPSMRNTKQWTGPLAFRLGNHLYADLADGDPIVDFAPLVRELAVRGIHLRNPAIPISPPLPSASSPAPASATAAPPSAPCAAMSSSPSPSSSSSSSSGAAAEAMIAFEIHTVLRGHTNSVASVCFSADGKLIASAGKDAVVRLWAADDAKEKQWKELHKLLQHKAPVSAVLFAGRADRYLLSADDAAEIICWDVNTGSPRQTFKRHRAPILSMTTLRFCAGTSDNNVVVSVSEDRTMRFWDLSLMDMIGGVQLPGRCCACVTANPTLPRLATGHLDPNNTVIWDVPSVLKENQAAATVVKTLSHHSDGVRTVSFNRTGTLLATGSWDMTVAVDLAAADSYSLHRLFDGHTDKINSVAFVDDRYLFAGGNEKCLKIWRVEMTVVSRGGDACVQSIPLTADFIRTAAVSDDAKTIVLGSKDMTLIVLNRTL